MYEPRPDDVILPPTQPIDLSWLIAHNAESVEDK